MARLAFTCHLRLLHWHGMPRVAMGALTLQFLAPRRTARSSVQEVITFVATGVQPWRRLTPAAPQRGVFKQHATAVGVLRSWSCTFGADLLFLLCDVSHEFAVIVLIVVH